jgi:hypothetical protein
MQSSGSQFSSEANPAPPQLVEKGSKWTLPYAEDAIAGPKPLQEKELAEYQREMAGVPY